MSGKDERDSAGRKQPSKYLRKKRAANAARHRWKQKCELVPGIPLSWSERSFANKLRHLAAAKKGGETTGSQIKEQQRVFWRWYYGDCKEQLSGPFKTVVETFERIEAAYVQRHGHNGSKWIEWGGFVADVFVTYILVACGSLKPDVVEQEMWARYEEFMEADEAALYGDGKTPGLLKALHDYDDAREAKRVRLQMWRLKNSLG